MRKKLSEPRNSLRLAGLSGTGKTRLAQALFDNSIGEIPLDKSIVIYGDISDMPKPDPIEYIQKLVNSRKRIILIVDNCEPSMHNKLTKLCQVIGSNVSLLTIEYDVKEDVKHPLFEPKKDPYAEIFEDTSILGEKGISGADKLNAQNAKMMLEN